MQTDKPVSDMESLQSQITSASEKFDQALKKDMELAETKKLFRELKNLKEKLDELTEKNSGTEEKK